MDNWIQWVFGILASAGTLGAAWVGGRRIVRRVARRWRFIGALAAEFGEDAATLIGIIRTFESGHGQLELRQRIAERHAALGIYTCDPDGRCTWCNDWVCEAYRIDSADIVGFGWIAAVAKEDQQRVRDRWLDCVQHQTPYRDEFIVEPTNGDPWMATAEAWPVKNSAGEIVCFVGCVTETDTS